jgi:hypothetical protein
VKTFTSEKTAVGGTGELYLYAHVESGDQAGVERI